MNRLDHVIPTLVQALSAPFLLIYDVEKYRGLGTPLARWFAENQDVLQQGVASGKLPSVWHGLWLYNRRSGTLNGYRQTVNSRNENDADLGILLISIIRPENVGDGSCSFSEMVERGPSAAGHTCRASACKKASESSGLVASRTGAGAGTPPPPATSDERGGEVIVAPGGVSQSLFAVNACDPGEGTGSGPCAGGSVRGNDRLADALNCIADLRMESYDKVLRCTAEATGRCAKPAEQYTKRLETALFGGVPMGKACQLRKDGEGGTGKEDTHKEDLEKLKKEAAKVQDEAMNTLHYLEEQKKKSEDATKKYENADRKTVDPEELKKLEADADKESRKLDTAEKYFKSLIKELRDIERRHGIIRDAYDKNIPQLARCAPDISECGSNQCSAMANAVARYGACLQPSGSPSPPPAPRGGTFDPSPDSPDQGAWAKCTDVLFAERPKNTSCWAVKCGSRSKTTRASDGTCGCQPGGAASGGTPVDFQDAFCGATDCGEGKRQEGCACVKLGMMAPPPPAPEPKGHPTGTQLTRLKLPPATLYSDMRARRPEK
jgi:hypothetical protein